MTGNPLEGAIDRRATSIARIRAAQAAAQAANDAFHASLVRAFGRQACNRRYDEDTSRHPEECRRLGAAFVAASTALQIAWEAGDAAGNTTVDEHLDE